MTNRDNRIEALRTIAILLVVVGHSIIIYSSSWRIYSAPIQSPGFDILKKCIDLIQMPLFFAISGYLFYLTSSKPIRFIQFCKDKSRRLIIPYMIFALFWVIPIRLAVSYPNYTGIPLYRIIVNATVLGIDNGHLWFLPALFLNLVIACLIYGYISKLASTPIHGMLMFIFIFGLCKVGTHYIHFSFPKDALTYLPWFCFGFLLKKFKLTMEHIRHIHFVKLVLSISIIGLYFAQHRINALAPIVSAFSITFLFLATPLINSKAIHFLDQNSFGIYLFHSPMVYITYTYCATIHPVAMFGINVFAFGSIATILVLLFRKCGLHAALGEKNFRKP